MSLADKLTAALRRHKLHPVVSVIAPTPAPNLQTTYMTLQDGLQWAHNHPPDEFGTIVIIVENIENNIQLPLKTGNYVISDIQKRSNGKYEVHLATK